MMPKRMSEWLIVGKTAVILLAGFFLLSSCKSTGLDTPTVVPGSRPETAVPTIVPTATATPLSTSTPTATPSPTPTFTPTATAVPITTTGNPRNAILSNPEPQDNARCGIVDILDFPLDPPDALDVSYGGQGFGRFRSRYDQFHAGEDWQLVRGRSNLGKPVYAIGHGRVTYAHPNGWGRDKGVIIIRHTFADDSTVLSFYGHMEPDSVTLNAGDCVVRGQKIAEIGQPRTPPHLHFEIRTHMPGEPGPGYWPTDPTEAGWRSPSQFIWNNRMAVQEGVVWTRPFIAEGTHNVGLVNGDTLIALEGGHLVGLNVADGRLRWQHAITETVAAALMDVDQSLLYTTDRRGQVAAYPLLELEEGTITLSPDPLWMVDLEKVGAPTLLPMAGGGVVVSIWQDMVAISANGQVLWQEEMGKRPFDWLLTEDQLILTLTGNKGPIYSLTTSDLQAWSVPLSGKLVSVGEQIWLYAYDGLYRLDTVTMTVELLYQLPPSFLGLGSVIGLPDGGIMLAHREREDSRLIVLNPDGIVQWQRSYHQPGLGEPHLLLHNRQPYLLLQSGSDLSTQLLLYAVDQQNSTLRHIFTGGTRAPLPDGNWFVSVNDDLLLINVGGGSMAVLDLATAVSFQ